MWRDNTEGSGLNTHTKQNMSQLHKEVWIPWIRKSQVIAVNINN